MTAWDKLVDTICPPGTPTNDRAWRLPGGASYDGSLRSGFYANSPLCYMRHCTVPRYVLGWVLRGHGSFVDHRGHSFRFGPGDCFQRFPDRHHALLFDNPDAAAYWFLALPPDFYQPMRLAGLGREDQAVFSAGIDVRLLRRALAYHRTLREARDDELAPSLAEAFALTCALHDRHRKRQAHAAAPWLNRACALLADDALALPAIATECGLGVSSLRERFKAATGLSPVRWRIRQRLRRAQELLSGSHSIAAIATELGYPSTAAFTRQFSTETGMTPSAWRSTQ
ncbi:MAG: AraC family transcriptional regulator [Planctomycetota bacterium]|jgi:AraC-like DNA-binding protein|nr:AraC family transcriptional regulator [Planctomycetota bacterium]